MSIYNNKSSDYFKPIKSGEFNIPKENYKHILEMPNDGSIPSRILGKSVAVWSNAKIDLNRLSNLKVNDDIVFDVTLKVEDADKIQTKVLDTLLALLGEDEEAAQQLVKLLEQYWGTLAVKLLLRGKETDEVDLEATKNISVISNTHNVKIGNGQFKVIHEGFFKISNIDDPEGIESPYHYIKAKVIISGSIKDLKNKDFSKLEYKFMNTDEKEDPKASSQDKYGSILKRFNEDYKSSFS